MSDARGIDTLWRTRTVTHGQAPRAMIPVLVAPGELGTPVAFRERAQGVAADGGFPCPEAGQRLAMAGAFPRLEGSGEALASFRSTVGTLLVDDVQPCYDRLVAAGAASSSPCSACRPARRPTPCTRWHRGRVRASPPDRQGR